MKGKMFKSAVAVALTASVVGAQSPATAEAAEGDFELTIMHTNDTHANLDKIANRATLVKQIRAEKPNNLLLDAGDVFSGTLYFNTFEGQADLPFMNLMKYDAMTFGNHEFDLGSSERGHQSLADFVEGAEFPFVAANVDFAGDEIMAGYQNKVYTADYNNGEIYNGVIKEIDGEKVGIFGLTTAETASISSPGEITFSNYIEAAQEAVEAFEAEGINKIVALTHIGFDDSAEFDNDRLLAEAVEGIDVIVGGHTHAKLETPFVFDGNTDPTVIVQANEYNKFLGQLDVTFNAEGVITSHTGKLHDVNAEGIVADAEAAELLAPYAADVEEVKNQSTGATAEVFLNGGRNEGGVRTSETNLGNLITDGMLATAKTIDPNTVIAVQNGGGIRASINVGDITVGEVLTTMPFGNALAIMNLTGAELKTALEHSVRQFPAENGGFLHVSGLEFSFDQSKPAGSRVTSVNVVTGNVRAALEENRTYKVATNTFTAKGGDGFTSFEAAYKDGRVSEPGNIDYQMFIDYIASLETVKPELENRINPTIPFKDMTMNRWSYPYVKDAFHRGLINGTALDTFSPTRELTRWEAATLIYRLMGLESAEASASPFTDISDLPTARQQEINAVFAEGYITGKTATKFNPREKISRAHFALLLNRVYEKVNGDYTVDEYAKYSDYGKHTAETKEAITLLDDLGIVEGYNGKFMPSKFTSREETAKMLSLFAPHTTK
ncbi:multifunctional 2',3'-cyclic-nucleotide 2'-phosphodiesterase/5'-nucleotidase/3'-nucleotidase [Planococcus sp. CPCC 101016]|uniref:5'-nucleotidase C-terminal domain-containing protein n=1 Tax=Planococcus sp. CPCC 101016 TaxID=2599617 RepID=UPI0011B70100|nr:5'-nucleotidase C-terminal domain-containing protein [Planococcus sp. CPCC 101016]TWT07013.1 multifunctional 2',3'-cyclic-nucleotide 2'-phosphodiesterase/5'-nucleotidase/3'-nucleotidase [Planococcus sp. CPCC 101016]